MYLMLICLLKETIEFFLNGFCWINWIQWIMTQSKSGMVTLENQSLSIDTFLDEATKTNF